MHYISIELQLVSTLQRYDLDRQHIVCVVRSVLLLQLVYVRNVACLPRENSGHMFELTTRSEVSAYINYQLEYNRISRVSPLY